MEQQLKRVVSKEELMTLPLRGVVMFAAKCARYVQSYFDQWNVGNEERRKDVEAAITLAEDFAEGNRHPHEISSNDEVPKKAEGACEAANQSNASHAAFAGETAAYAGDAALKAARSLQSGKGDAPTWETAARSLAYDAQQRMLLALQAVGNTEGGIVARGIFDEVAGRYLGPS